MSSLSPQRPSSSDISRLGSVERQEDPGLVVSGCLFCLYLSIFELPNDKFANGLTRARFSFKRIQFPSEKIFSIWKYF